MPLHLDGFGLFSSICEGRGGGRRKGGDRRKGGVGIMVENEELMGGRRGWGAGEGGE